MVRACANCDTSSSRNRLPPAPDGLICWRSNQGLRRTISGKLRFGSVKLPSVEINMRLLSLYRGAIHVCHHKHYPKTEGRVVPWNKAKLLGQKPPLKLKEIWAIRIRLQLDHRSRE